MSADTIFALATPPGTGGVAVIRVSGLSADAALSALSTAPLPDPRRATLRRLTDPETGDPLDHPLVLRFLAGESFTGEQSVEFHLHGGRAVVASVMQALTRLPGLRLANPGEFTRRAFDNGRLDLAQVEGLADLISAETASQQRAALHQYSGILGDKCRAWSARLTRGLALLEATIDFADEEIPDDTWAHASDAILSVRAEIIAHLATAHLSERLRTGWRIAILGAPNAGKSTLINALSGRDIAITSDIAGTTRDIIEAQMDLAGYPVTLVDTAGIRETIDPIERIGVDRATNAATTADLRLALTAHDAPLTDAIRALLQAGDLIIHTKADAQPGGDLAISARTGQGIATLIDRLTATLAIADPPADALLLTQRHAAALTDACAALDRYAALATDTPDRLKAAPEIGAQDVREAWEALGHITGERGIDRLLDVIFSEFCLGK